MLIVVKIKYKSIFIAAETMLSIIYSSVKQCFYFKVTMFRSIIDLEYPVSKMPILLHENVFSANESRAKFSVWSFYHLTSSIGVVR